MRIVVGFSAGGTTDVIARIMAKELTESLGQSFVVENKPGGGSNIATDYVARATPDGYTLLFVAVTSAINQTLYTNVNFDLVKDFAPVALGAKVPNILVINPQVPVKSVQELVAYAKAHPGKLASPFGQRHLHPHGGRTVQAACRHRRAARALQGSARP